MPGVTLIMAANREMCSPLTSFNNLDAVSFQGVHQTINANSIILSDGPRAENIRIDEEGQFLNNQIRVFS